MEDYAERVQKYSKEELIEVLSSIDREKFPDRFQIARRRYEEIKDDPAFARTDPLEKYQIGTRRFFAMGIDGSIVQHICKIKVVAYPDESKIGFRSAFLREISPIILVVITLPLGMVSAFSDMKVPVEMFFPRDWCLGLALSLG